MIRTISNHLIRTVAMVQEILIIRVQTNTSSSTTVTMQITVTTIKATILVTDTTIKVTDTTIKVTVISLVMAIAAMITSIQVRVLTTADLSTLTRASDLTKEHR